MSELPTGTVTFLFTDVEGSTRLLKQLRERYGDVRAEHERLLREAFEANGGQEIDTQGDSFFVAFRRARDAVNAAVAGQRALADHHWPEGADVRVRIGIHTGEPLAAEGRYVGLGVHRAARISAAGHGGQVLLSNATRELVEDDLPPEVHLRDLGEHRLKDIDRPERLFQLEAEGLQVDFPPLKTLEAQPAEAPFAGREGELAEAAEAAVAHPRLHSRRAVLFVVGAAVVAAAAVAAAIVIGGTDEANALRGIDANAVGIVDADDNEFASEIEVDAAPGHMAAARDALWVANADANTVSRIDLETNSVRDTIRVGSGPSAVAAGADAVWITNGLGRTVSRIDPKTNEVVQTIGVGNGPAGVAEGEGAVWVANANDASLSKLDPASGDVLATIDVGGGANAVAVGFGSVWVANGTSASVSRVDPRANTVVQAVNVGNAPTSLAVGFGSVWVANRADGTVSRIDPERNVVTTTIAVGESPSAIAVGDDAVWVTDELAGKLVRIDPGRSEIERKLEIGNRPEGVTVVDDSVYVAVRAAGTAHRGGTLRVRAGFIDSLDPAIAYVPASLSILSITNDGLTGYRRVGGGAGSQLVPNLAAALPTATDGGRTYTFRLRRGIRYSTGAPVRAADFRRAIERSLKVKVSPAGFYVAGIVGAGRCGDSPRTCDLSRGILTNEAARTVTFRLTEPDADLPYKLTLPFAYPVPAGVKAGKPVPATGPYMVAASSKREVRLERNPRFRVWSNAARPPGIPDRIVWRLGRAQEAQVAAVERGEADVAFEGVPGSVFERIATRFSSQLHANPAHATHFVFLNTRVPPFDDVRVRRALNYALDRTAIVQAFGGPEQAQPTCQVLPPNFPGYTPYCPYTANPTPGGAWSAPDLARARRLIDASGTKGMEVSLWWTKGFPGYAAPAPIESLLRTLGYRVRLKMIDDVLPYYLHTSDTRNRVQAGANGWITDYQSAFGFVTVLSCRSFVPRSSEGANINLAGFCDRRIERDITRALNLQASDLPAANELWAKIDHAITDRAPWLFLVNPKTTVFVSERVGNFQHNPQWGVLVDQLWVR